MRYHQVFCIVDALDEFSPRYDERINLVKDLVSIARTTQRGVWRICVTSRDDSRSHAHSKPALELPVKIPRWELEAYISEQIKSSDLLLRLIQHRASLQKKIIDTVLDKSDQM